MGIGYWADAPQYDRDVDAAKALLQEAGVSNLELSLTYTEETGSKIVAQVVQENLAEVGIDVSLNLARLGRVLRRSARASASASSSTWDSSTQPDPSWSFVWFTCSQIDVWNWQYWCDSEFDSLHFAAHQGARTRRSAVRCTSRCSSSGTPGQRRLDALPTNYFGHRVGIEPAITPHGRFLPHALPGGVDDRRRTRPDGPLHRAAHRHVGDRRAAGDGVPRRVRPPRAGRSRQDHPRPARERGALADRAGGDGPRRARPGPGLELRRSVRAGRPRQRLRQPPARHDPARRRRCRTRSSSPSASLGLAVLLGCPLGVYAATRPNGWVDRITARGLGLAHHAARIRGRALPAAGLRHRARRAAGHRRGRLLGPRRLCPAPDPARPWRSPRHGSDTSRASCARACSRCSGRTTSARRAPSACATASSSTSTRSRTRSSRPWRCSASGSAACLGGAVFVEVIFSRPGLGTLIVDSIAEPQLPDRPRRHARHRPVLRVREPRRGPLLRVPRSPDPRPGTDGIGDDRGRPPRRPRAPAGASCPGPGAPGGGPPAGGPVRAAGRGRRCS